MLTRAQWQPTLTLAKRLILMMSMEEVAHQDLPADPNISHDDYLYSLSLPKATER